MSSTSPDSLEELKTLISKKNLKNMEKLLTVISSETPSLKIAEDLDSSLSKNQAMP
jgi:hypothetical protein